MGSNMVVRFGLGDPSGWRSSSWRVWANRATPDIYLANRDTAHMLKVSIHASGQWHYAFNTEEKAMAAQVEPSGERFIARWDGEETRLSGAPIRQAFAVVLGRFSLGFPPDPIDASEHANRTRSAAPVEWIKELPPAGPHAWQFTVLVSDGDVQTTPPGTRSMGAVPVGGFVLSNGASLWVMRHMVTLGESGWANVELAARAAIQHLGHPTEPMVYRTDLSGKEPSGLRWIIETAVTANPSAPHQPA